MAEYVRHKTDPNGALYSVQDEGELDWIVIGPGPRSAMFALPKADYITIPVPERWVDITHECCIGRYGPEDFEKGNYYALNNRIWVTDATGINITDNLNYRFRIVNGKIIIERKES